MPQEMIKSLSVEKTQKFAQQFAKSLRAGDVIALHGDLGYGKTTFVQGLAKGLGLKQKIISPTFIIVRSYKFTNQESETINFYHIDLYRIENEGEIEGLGLHEIMGNKENLVVIEWPEKMGKFLPEKRIDINFEYKNENERMLTVQKYE